MHLGAELCKRNNVVTCRSLVLPSPRTGPGALKADSDGIRRSGKSSKPWIRQIRITTTKMAHVTLLRPGRALHFAVAFVGDGAPGPCAICVPHGGNCTESYEPNQPGSGRTGAGPRELHRDSHDELRIDSAIIRGAIWASFQAAPCIPATSAPDRRHVNS